MSRLRLTWAPAISLGVIYVMAALFAYLIGSFPTGVVLSRKKYGIDVREIGSGNIGATNVTRVFGWYAGALTLFADFLKGFLPLYFVHRYFPDDPWFLVVAGTALVIGHCFSLFLGFKGGKGVATSLGCVVVVAPWVSLLAVIVYASLVLGTKISAVGSLGGMLVVVGYLILGNPSETSAVLLVALSLIVLIRHKDNLRRLYSTARTRG